LPRNSRRDFMTSGNAALWQRCEQSREEMITLWERLVNIDSGSGYGKGLTQLGLLLTEELKSLGAEIRQHQLPGGDRGFHIVTSFQGTGKGSVLLLAHMDTVFPEGAAKLRPFKIEDGKAYGPGVSDCKGGILLCIQALRNIKETGFRDFGRITCIFNCDEEIFSPDSRAIIQSEAQTHSYTLCIEPGSVDDGVVTWRKGGGVLTVEVTGRAAHAGAAPERGRNAAMELINQIARLSALEDKSKLTTINFTVMQAGERTNVIPDYAMAKADIRALYPEEFSRLELAANEISGQIIIPDTEVKIGIIKNNPPFSPNEFTDRLAQKAAEIYGELGKTLKTTGEGGISDANWAAAAGSIVIDGLGPVSRRAHTDKETADVESVVPRLYLLTRLLMELGK
jgi:glutamate carboxypeptidase